ncbi:MAG: hypothetical protein R3F61_32535 [Myxococcota bacterium]
MVSSRALGIAALFGLFAALPLSASEPFDFGFGQGMAPIPYEGAPPPGRCEPCHAEITADWSASRHHVAWTNDLMIAGFVAEPLEFCVNCHAPLPEQRAEVLANQAFYRSLDPRRRNGPIPAQLPEPTAAHGIHCATCHLRGDVTLAPSKSDASPHDTRVEPGMSAGDFCVSCHEFPMPVTHAGVTTLSDAPMQSTGTEWRAWVATVRESRSRRDEPGSPTAATVRESRSRRDEPGSPTAATVPESCQDCHMPGGRHVFRGAHDREWLKTAVSVERSAGRLTLRSVGVGHHFPSGDLFRHVTVEIDRGTGWEVVDWIGRRFERGADDVRRVASDTSLRPGEPRQVEVPAAFERWRLVYHYGSETDEKRGLLDPAQITFTLAEGSGRLQ